MIILGWLQLYQAGYMHCNISIGNVLRLRTPKERSEFLVDTRLMEKVLRQDVRDAGLTTNTEYLSSSQESLGSSQADREPETVLPSESSRDELSFIKCACLFQEVIHEMTLPPCCGFISDGDLAAHWVTYFRREGCSREHSVSSIGYPPVSLVSDQLYVLFRERQSSCLPGSGI